MTTIIESSNAVPTYFHSRERMLGRTTIAAHAKAAAAISVTLFWLAALIVVARSSVDSGWLPAR
jgi:hypothetical protein